MYHRRSRNRLSQKPGHARLIRRNLATSLLLYESIRTTHKRAKVVQPIIDRLIHTAKTKEPQRAIRAINAVVLDKNACRKLMEVFVHRFEKRSSGFTRIIPVGARQGDGAKLVDLVLVEGIPSPPKKTSSRVQE
ncbi:50S ribosomal protein L17 [Candidatus Peribacteria bacterium RIFCSPHIGHO2_01_FULL_51_9]|nr:MAG: 50S ribosomal protein L17 [Candidatus Peribacteria bacterium RIFCSPHIGHO2_01_FULL_51_9]